MKTDIDLIPMYHYDRIERITIDDIKSWGVKAVAVDIDNTLCYDATKRFIGNSKKWVENIRKSGIPVIIVSNARKSRALKIAGTLGIPCVPIGGKPKSEPFFTAADMLNVGISEIAFIGDQIFSDVKGANKAGAVSVYVEPPAKEIVFYFFYRYRRYKERPVIKRMLELERSSGEEHKVR